MFVYKLHIAFKLPAFYVVTSDSYWYNHQRALLSHQIASCYCFFFLLYVYWMFLFHVMKRFITAERIVALCIWFKGGFSLIIKDTKLIFITEEYLLFMQWSWGNRICVGMNRYTSGMIPADLTSCSYWLWATPRSIRIGYAVSNNGDMYDLCGGFPTEYRCFVFWVYIVSPICLLHSINRFNNSGSCSLDSATTAVSSAYLMLVTLTPVILVPTVRSSRDVLIHWTGKARGRNPVALQVVCLPI